MDLTTLTTPRPAGDGAYDLEVPDGWQQGRGAFGGFVLAALVRAIEAEAGGEGRLLRSLTAELPGPTLAGAARIDVETLRAGSSVTTAAARLTQGDGLRAHAVGVLGRDRAGDAAAPAPHDPPRLRPWREMEPLDLQGGPAFARHFELRVDGPLPFSAGHEAVLMGWIRARDPGEARGPAHLAALIDGFWPAAFALWSGPRPVGTVSFALAVTGDAAALDPEVPLAYRARTLASHGGYMAELRELWAPSGELVALNQQSIAVIR